MIRDREEDYLHGLVQELCKLSDETEWVEFKLSMRDVEETGEYVSALANSAALAGKAFAYILWGITDDDNQIVGTSFRPSTKKVGNEQFENWLLRLLKPRINFRFFEILVDEKPVVLLEIERAFRHPVQFKGKEFIRIGSYKKPLKDFPERERALWRIFDETPFEKRIAAEHIGDDAVLRLLDYPSYFELTGRQLPANQAAILTDLASDDLIRRCDAGGWNLTNLGVALFSRNFSDTTQLERKAIRVIQYQGNNRAKTIREQVGVKGYASGFQGLIDFINGLLPSNEEIGAALRKTVPRFPEIAIRELVANALIHQDFSLTGTGPMVEIFEDRVEITNPGKPLVDIRRLVDLPPRSRNESLASFMRRIGICEERGSGWDKIALQCELHQLPAPVVEVVGDHLRIVLFAPRPLSKMSKEDRIRAIYLHACWRYVNNDYVTNSSVRKRFGIEKRNSAKASRMIAESIEAEMILHEDPYASRKLMRYVPWWAKLNDEEVV